VAYDNTNRGALFPNNRKERDTHPDMTGKLNVDGKEYYLSAWKKTSRDGGGFISVSVKPVEVTHQAGPTRAESPNYDPFNDDMPF
jgi:uncharacterized protein (DUF736 family)